MQLHIFYFFLVHPSTWLGTIQFWVCSDYCVCGFQQTNTNQNEQPPKQKKQTTHQNIVCNKPMLDFFRPPEQDRPNNCTTRRSKVINRFTSCPQQKQNQSISATKQIRTLPSTMKQPNPGQHKQLLLAAFNIIVTRITNANTYKTTKSRNTSILEPTGMTKSQPGKQKQTQHLP